MIQINYFLYYLLIYKPRKGLFSPFDQGTLTCRLPVIPPAAFLQT